jgi:hypothetical protein
MKVAWQFTARNAFTKRPVHKIDSTSIFTVATRRQLQSEYFLDGLKSCATPRAANGSRTRTARPTEPPGVSDDGAKSGRRVGGRLSHVTQLPKAGPFPQSARKICVSRLPAELLLRLSAKEAGLRQKPSSLLRRALMPAISELPAVQG